MSLYGLCGKRNTLQSKQVPLYFSSWYLRKIQGMQNKALFTKGASSSDIDYKTKWNGWWKQHQHLRLIYNRHLEAMQKQYSKVLIRYKGTDR